MNWTSGKIFWSTYLLNGSLLLSIVKNIVLYLISIIQQMQSVKIEFVESFEAVSKVKLINHNVY